LLVLVVAVVPVVVEPVVFFKVPIMEWMPLVTIKFLSVLVVRAEAEDLGTRQLTQQMVKTQLSEH
jgi:hypothetical protein